MNSKKEFDLFVDELLSGAVGAFRETEEYRLLGEKLEKMDQDCENMLGPDERAFAVECFELLTSVQGRQEEYVYRKGLTDCVSILKSLGVLA